MYVWVSSDTFGYLARCRRRCRAGNSETSRGAYPAAHWPECEKYAKRSFWELALLNGRARHLYTMRLAAVSPTGGGFLPTAASTEDFLPCRRARQQEGPRVGVSPSEWFPCLQPTCRLRLCRPELRPVNGRSHGVRQDNPVAATSDHRLRDGGFTLSTACGIFNAELGPAPCQTRPRVPVTGSSGPS
jgi:hypothetical protein